MCRQQKDQEILNKHNEGISNEAKSTKQFPKSTNNQGEDNSSYYELGDFSQESQYDKLPSHDWHNHRNLFSVHNYVYEYHSHFQRIPCKITYPQLFFTAQQFNTFVKNYTRYFLWRIAIY